MKVVGLLSGGKDSVYNLLHCYINQHEPIALASLGPPPGQDELDSYMYQTVAHSGLTSIAQALNLPLFTRTITGKSIHQGKEYGQRKGQGQGARDDEDEGEDLEDDEDRDETEDLWQLLYNVKKALPSVQAVACGAILSNYQRVRVEHVCSRLSLTPLCYLWERPQRPLLAEMVRAGMDSRLVKVAGAGLQVEHLGKSLEEMQATLCKLNALYSLHICGEGGEYETFTVDCPLFERRVVLEQTTTIISDPSPYSTVAHLHLDKCSLAPSTLSYSHSHSHEGKGEKETFDQKRLRLLPLVKVPRVLDRESRRVEKAATSGVARMLSRLDGQLGGRSSGVGEEEREGGGEEGSQGGEVTMSSLGETLPSIPKLRVESGGEEEGTRTTRIRKPTSKRVGEWLYFGEVYASSSEQTEQEQEGAEQVEIALEEEVRSAFSTLISLLQSHSTTLLSVSHLTVYLSRDCMPLFPRINAIYATYFGSSPPTRACVAVALLSPSPSTRTRTRPRTRIKLEGIAALGGQRNCLHVQSLSYWAPANIGPYSQGITSLSQRLFIAGQIPLLPASLTLPLPTSEGEAEDGRAFAFDVALSLQHVRRAWRAATEGRWIGWSEGGVCWLRPSQGSSEGDGEAMWRRRIAQSERGWRAAERVMGGGGLTAGVDEGEDDEEEEEKGEIDEEADAEAEDEGRGAAPMLFVEAAELPRGASVEWQVTFATGQRDQAEVQAEEEEDSDGADVDQRPKRRALAETWSKEEVKEGMSYQCSRSEGISRSVVAILACDSDQAFRHPLPSLAQIHCIKAFHLPHLSLSSIEKSASIALGLSIEELPALSTVGVSRIATGKRDRWEMAFVVTAEVAEL